MSSGRKLTRINTRERVVSADINRLQAFTQAWENEALREQMLAPIDDSLAVGTTFGVGATNTTAIDIVHPSAPLYGGVLNGLMVIVPIGVSYILISKGAVLVVDPDGEAGSSNPNPANPDDLGPAKLVYSAGVQTVGSLTWTPNPGPGVRVDVVECQRTDLVVETDNRDVFNPSTGLFTPTAVTKVTAGELVFRVRQGVAGGGLPSPALGWFPLAIIAAPAGAANLDACTVWDVRNLLSDLTTPFANVRSVFPRIEKYQFFADRFTNPAQIRLSGQALGNYNGWKIGGLFAQTFAQPWTDIADATYAWGAGFAPIPGLVYYVYALWPLGYVRWVKYFTTAVAGVGGRCPGPFRGVLTISHVPPVNGQPVAPVATPSGWGLSVSTILGQALASGVVDTGGTMLGFVADGDMVHHEDNTLLPPIIAAITQVGDNFDIDFALLPGIHFPIGARRVRLIVGLLTTGSAAGDQYYAQYIATVRDTASGNVIAEVDALGVGVTALGLVQPWVWTVDFPTGADGLSAPPALTHRWNAYLGPVGAAPTLTGLAAQAVVVGWDE